MKNINKQIERYVNNHYYTKFMYNNEKEMINKIYDQFIIDSMRGYGAIYENNYFDYQQMLYENLNTSSTSEELYNYLMKIKQKTTAILDINFDYVFDIQINKLLLDIHNKQYNITLKQIDKICYLLKWYYNSFIDHLFNKDILVLTFNPIYDVELTDIVYEKLNGILYHFCPCVDNPKNTTYDKLINKGLMLKSQTINDNHPERIYFYMNVSDKNKQIYCKNFYNKLQDTYKKQHIKFYYLIKVDLNKNNFKIHLYMDNFAQNAVYTMENIHPRCLEIIEKIYI